MRHAWLRALLLVLVALAIGACKEYATRPYERVPTISSVEWTPSSLGPGDSLVVTVHASDPDGDTLVYDWFTDARLRIQGASAGVYLYGSSSNSRRFYRSTTSASPDTAWIRCYARDQRGGSDGRILLIPLVD